MMMKMKKIKKRLSRREHPREEHANLLKKLSKIKNESKKMRKMKMKLRRKRNKLPKKETNLKKMHLHQEDKEVRRSSRKRKLIQKK